MTFEQPGADRPPSGYRVALPDGWFSVPIERPGSMGALRKLLDQAQQQDEDIRAHRGEIERLLFQVTTDAELAGVRSCAFTFTTIAQVLPVQASLTVAVRAVGDENDLTSMYRALSEDETDRRVEVVDLARVGPVVRRSGLRRGTFPAAANAIEYFSRQFYVPVPRAADVLLLAFATPSVEVVEELSDLFDRIAHTFEFTYGEGGEASL